MPRSGNSSQVMLVAMSEHPNIRIQFDSEFLNDVGRVVNL